MSSNQSKITFLEEAGSVTPEYGEVFTLFKEIFRYIDTLQGETGISFTIETKHQAERVQGGFPLLTAEVMSIDIPKASSFMAGLLELLKQRSPDGTAELDQLATALQDGKLNLAALLGACLRRDRAALEEIAVSGDLKAPLLEFVLETMLKAALEPLAATLSTADFEGWQEGYCPVCGSRAGMGELAGEDGRRYLSCCTCFFKWPYKRLQCPYCKNDDPEHLSYFTVDEGPTRVDVCTRCSRFLKTRDSRKGHADVPLEVEDLATIHLDLVAGKEGFERGK